MINSNVDKFFDKRQTNIAKGVALLLLLWHHLFYNSPEKYEMFTSLFMFHGVPIECILADFCKVCVAIFLLLSGYGLTKSFSKYYEQNCINGRIAFKKIGRYVFNHLLKLLSDYWFIYIVFVPMGLLFGRSFLLYYGINPIYYLSDFFGVNFLLFAGNGTMNATWWFMSIIIIYYLIFPLLYKILNYSPELLFLISISLLFFPYLSDFRQLKLWLCPFVFGMYISNNYIFEVLGKKINTVFKGLICSLLFIIIIAFLRIDLFNNSVLIDFLFAFSIILLSFFVLSRIPVLNTLLEKLGKHSGAIFMFHTFIYSYYFHGLIYWFKYAPIILIVLTLVCYLIAVVLAWLKKLVRYDKLIIKFIKTTKVEAK